MTTYGLVRSNLIEQRYTANRQAAYSHAQVVLRELRTGRVETVPIPALAEILESDSNIFVAYRHGQRCFKTCERVAPNGHHVRPAFRQGGVYLITGGLGKLGIVLSE